MKNCPRFLMFVFALMLVGVVGCSKANKHDQDAKSSKNSPESLTEEMLAEMDQIASCFASMKDKASVKKGEQELNNSLKRLEDVVRRAEEFKGKWLSAEAQERYQPKLVAVAGRMDKAMQQAGTVPGASEVIEGFLWRFQGIVQYFAFQMNERS